MNEQLIRNIVDAKHDYLLLEDEIEKLCLSDLPKKVVSNKEWQKFFSKFIRKNSIDYSKYE